MEQGMAFASPARIPEPEFADRRRRAAAAARAAGLDGLLVVGRSSGSLDMLMNIYWLTRHYFVPPMVVPTGFWRAYGFDFLVLDGDGRGALATCGTTDAPVIDDIRLGLDVEQLFVDAIRDLGLDPWPRRPRRERGAAVDRLRAPAARVPGPRSSSPPTC